MGRPRMLSVHNTVTDRNEWLEFLLPHEVLELIIPPTNRLSSSVGERLACHGEVPSSIPGSGRSFLFLHKDLWETKIGTINYRNLIYNANLGGMERWLFLRIIITFTPILWPSTWHPMLEPIFFVCRVTPFCTVWSFPHSPFLL